MRLLGQEKPQRRPDYQHVTLSENSHEFGGGSTELSENRARSELAVGASAHEMQG